MSQPSSQMLAFCPIMKLPGARTAAHKDSVGRPTKRTGERNASSIRLLSEEPPEYDSLSRNTTNLFLSQDSTDSKIYHSPLQSRCERMRTRKLCERPSGGYRLLKPWARRGTSFASRRMNH
ncbi:unnamed protein product [Nesidiocoris tenuis]|uniref:Uncharacterized protein n=1 Tax=Nesidiocoris tenuis TaxID=355587 RepID=A0A6H5HLM3_9HEMI|nr:unnamed protein product [Nesidiocoris tenuis]